MSFLRLAAYLLFVLVTACWFVWLSFTPIAFPVCMGIASLILLRAVMPLHWIPWLRPKAVRR